MLMQAVNKPLSRIICEVILHVEVKHLREIADEIRSELHNNANIRLRVALPVMCIIDKEKCYIGK